MMIEIFLLILLVVLGCISSYCDINAGIIPNRLILAFMGMGLMLDAIYYGIIARDIAVLFFRNFIITVMVSLILYSLHSLAGGDSKLIFAMALLYPAGFYITYAGVKVTLFFSVCLAVLIAYLALFIQSLWKIVKGEKHMEKKTIRQFVLEYLKSYCLALIYIVFLNACFVLLERTGIRLNDWIKWILCISVAWESGRQKLMKKQAAIILFGVADIGLPLFLWSFPLSLNPKSYVIMALLIVFQMVIRTNLYETIPISNVKKGMILSTLSSMIMQASGINGLPGISTEDLRDRLTDEQAESIRIWGKEAHGVCEISVVKKIPFAIYITAGFIGYFVLWSVVR